MPDDVELLERRVARLLLKRGLTVAVAESCTGGMLGASLTSQAGSSAYFPGGIIAYSNSVKKDLLGVEGETLAKAGAVSRETVAEMADEVRRLVGADIGIGVSGIAGPGGGTAEKPVGLVFIGCSDSAGVSVKEFRFSGDRDLIRKQSVEAALEMLREKIETEGEGNG